MKQGDLRVISSALHGEIAASPQTVGKIRIHNVGTKVDMIFGVVAMIFGPETGMTMEGKAPTILGTCAMMMVTNHAVGHASAV